MSGPGQQKVGSHPIQSDLEKSVKNSGFVCVLDGMFILHRPGSN